MSDLADLRIWEDPAIRGALSWYLDVAENRRPAKFRIAATVSTQLDLAVSSEKALWAEFDRLTPIFLARWQAIRSDFCDPASAKYRDKYAEIARRPSHAELDRSWRRARESVSISRLPLSNATMLLACQRCSRFKSDGQGSCHWR